MPQHGDDVGERLARAAMKAQRSIAVAESLTGGALSARLARLSGASEWYRGAVVAYSSEVKRHVLTVPLGPVVSETAAIAMADGVASLLTADMSISVTGVGGPEPQDGAAPGTVWMAVHQDHETSARCLWFDGSSEDVVRHTCDAALEWLLQCLDDADAVE
jgi:nicotinamide-nucleotide amidase